MGDVAHRVGGRRGVHEALGAVGAELHDRAVRLGRQASPRVAAGSAGDHDVELVERDHEPVEFPGVAVQRAHEDAVADGDHLAPIQEVGQTRVLEIDSSLDPAVVGEADEVDVRSPGLPCTFLGHLEISYRRVRTCTSDKDTPNEVVPTQ